jgi:hypothetical protein
MVRQEGNTYSSKVLQSGSGIIEIVVPQYNENIKSAHIKGVLQDDIQITMKNNWSPFSELNPHIMEKLQGLQQIWQADSVTNYIPTSAQAWKGTSPIVVSASFYLINFNSDANIQGKARILSNLCALNPESNTQTKFHGGYKMDLYDDEGALINELNYHDTLTVPGTCEIIINSERHTYIRGLLANEISIQPSTVSVWNNKKKRGEPLYYTINMSFLGHRAPVEKDLIHLFGGI